MYKHFVVACLAALSASAIKLFQETQDQEQTNDSSSMTITETDQEVESIDHAGVLNELGYTNFDNMTEDEQSKLMSLLHSTANSSAEVNVGSTEGSTSTGTSTATSGGDCGCGCQTTPCGCCEEEKRYWRY